MHKNYKVNVACLSTENFIKSLDEVKSFFSFNFIPIKADIKNIVFSDYNALILDTRFEKEINVESINIPIIFIEEKGKTKLLKKSFDAVLKLPLKITKFNQAVLDLCKKYEFNQNSLIKIKDYILDKNERVLKKGQKNLKITEKEIIFLDELNKSKVPLSKDYILKNIWAYSSQADTHTVETHIYRLRQKIKEKFLDDKFIKNLENGYYIEKKK